MRRPPLAAMRRLPLLLVALAFPAATRAQTAAVEVKDAAEGLLLRLNTDGGFVVRGDLYAGALPAAGAGVRLMWHPASAAFRAGSVDAAQWDEPNVGFGSLAAGTNTTASGLYATALGLTTTASGYAATATGWLTAASGAYATAAGSGTTASGDRATATGSGTTASGVASTALGLGTTAQAYGSLAFGQYNVPFGNPAAREETDPILVAGNGTGDEDRSNALLLLRNGDLNGFGRHSIFLNSSLTKVHLRLFETESDFARLRFENTASANYWDVAGLSGATLNFYTPARGDVMSLRSTGAPLVMVNGAYLSAGGAWTNASDRALKTGFAPADAAGVLARLVALPVTRWTYRADPDAPHVGPTAQDFRAAFGLGADDRSIATVDADGVLMLAAQALDARAAAQAARIAALEADNAALRAALGAQADRLAALERRLGAPPASPPSPERPR